MPSEPRTTNAPENISVTASGFADAAYARLVATVTGQCIRELTSVFDLSDLDGVTIACDYAQALRDLDSGCNRSQQLEASSGHVVGVAMTPAVLRDGALKSHILLNGQFIAPIADPEHADHELAVHLLVHECAHVDVTGKFDAAFPGVLLRKQAGDPREAFRWQIILACWDEFAATRLSARYGCDPTDGYEDTFLRHLFEAHELSRNAIKDYRVHGGIDQVLAQIFGIYGDLLKFSAYHLGNLAGLDVDVRERPRTVAALAGHWFEPYFWRLDAACREIYKDYGQWCDQTAFEAIGDIAEDLVAFGGLYLSYEPSGKLYVDIPYTEDTMPDEDA